MLSEESGAEAKVASFERASVGQPAVLDALRAAKDMPARDRIHKALLVVPVYAEGGRWSTRKTAATTSAAWRDAPRL